MQPGKDETNHFWLSFEKLQTLYLETLELQERYKLNAYNP